MNASSRTLADELYAKLTNEEDSRLCEDIDEKACQASPVDRDTKGQAVPGSPPV